jgi:hypothetical protein
MQLSIINPCWVVGTSLARLLRHSQLESRSRGTCLLVLGVKFTGGPTPTNARALPALPAGIACRT